MVLATRRLSYKESLRFFPAKTYQQELDTPASTLTLDCNRFSGRGFF